MEQASRTGLPAMRPLVFMYPDVGRNAWVDDEFLLGNDILVAPVLSEGTTSRSVYFPPGDWYEFASSKRYRGDTTFTVATPIESIPFFVRAGAAVPTQQIIQYTDQAPVDPLLLFVYPPSLGGTGTSEYYEDDGVSFRYQSGEYLRRKIEQRYESGKLTIALGPCEGTYAPADRGLILQVALNRHPREVHVDGFVTREQTEVTGRQSRPSWHFDEKTGFLSILMHDRRNNVMVIIQG
jgi:alpha-glucosidase